MFVTGSTHRLAYSHSANKQSNRVFETSVQDTWSGAAARRPPRSAPAPPSLSPGTPPAWPGTAITSSPASPSTSASPSSFPGSGGQSIKGPLTKLRVVQTKKWSQRTTSYFSQGFLVHPIVTVFLPTEDNIFGGRRHFRHFRASFLFTELFQPATRSWRKTALRIGFKFSTNGRTDRQTNGIAIRENKQTYGKRPNNNNALHGDFRGRTKHEGARRRTTGILRVWLYSRFLHKFLPWPTS
jgi:hypothetical protein